MAITNYYVFSQRKCARTGHFRNVLITFPNQNMYIAPQFPYHMISIELLYVHMLVGLTLMLFVQKCQLGLAKNISSLKLKQNFHFALETRNGTRFVILRRCNFTRKKKKIRCQWGTGVLIVQKKVIITVSKMISLGHERGNFWKMPQTIKTLFKSSNFECT